MFTVLSDSEAEDALSRNPLRAFVVTVSSFLEK